MNTVQLILLAVATSFAAYTYFGYPLLLWLAARLRPPRLHAAEVPDWPFISITVPAYNEEEEIRGLIETLLQLDYPRDRLQILIVSDASTDRTDSIVAEYEDAGVELLRLPNRLGKTAAEDSARSYLRGEIIVNTDASIRLAHEAIKALVIPFSDPTVGVVSGRDVSIARQSAVSNTGEARYVGYEMWVRGLETRIAGIVGASGCCYAIRAHLHGTALPAGLSRDFASALIARKHGYRAVSAPDAVCFVPRTSRLRAEYRRKVRTITRGIETLAHLRELLNPFRYGWFAVMLWNHKVCRWAAPWVAAGAIGGVVAVGNTASVLFGIGAASGLFLGVAGILWPERRSIPRVIAVAAYLLIGNAAAMQALVQAAAGKRDALWEPTRRTPLPAG